MKACSILTECLYSRRMLNLRKEHAGHTLVVGWSHAATCRSRLPLAPWQRERSNALSGVGKARHRFHLLLRTNLETTLPRSNTSKCPVYRTLSYQNVTRAFIFSPRRKVKELEGISPKGHWQKVNQDCLPKLLVSLITLSSPEAAGWQAGRIYRRAYHYSRGSVFSGYRV